MIFGSKSKLLFSEIFGSLIEEVDPRLEMFARSCLAIPFDHIERSYVSQAMPLMQD